MHFKPYGYVMHFNPYDNVIHFKSYGFWLCYVF